jgi:hypothetical protein
MNQKREGEVLDCESLKMSKQKLCVQGSRLLPLDCPALDISKIDTPALYLQEFATCANLVWQGVVSYFERDVIFPLFPCDRVISLVIHLGLLSLCVTYWIERPSVKGCTIYAEKGFSSVSYFKDLFEWINSRVVVV